MEVMLSHGDVMVFLHLGYPGLALPSGLPNVEGAVSLRFGYNLHPPIFDLALSDDALSGTLSFKGVPYPCTIPWGAVNAIRLDGVDHYVYWPREHAPTATVTEAPAPIPARPKFTLVP